MARLQHARNTGHARDTGKTCDFECVWESSRSNQQHAVARLVAFLDCRDRRFPARPNRARDMRSLIPYFSGFTDHVQRHSVVGGTSQRSFKRRSTVIYCRMPTHGNLPVGRSLVRWRRSDLISSIVDPRHCGCASPHQGESIMSTDTPTTTNGTGRPADATSPSTESAPDADTIPKVSSVVVLDAAGQISTGAPADEPPAEAAQPVVTLADRGTTPVEPTEATEDADRGGVSSLLASGPFIISLASVVTLVLYLLPGQAINPGEAGFWQDWGNYVAVGAGLLAALLASFAIRTGYFLLCRHNNEPDRVN